MRKIAILIVITSILLLSLVPLQTATANTETLYVDPPTNKVMVGKTFAINISIANVTNLYGWEFKLYYNNTMLNGTAIQEGPFLSMGGETFFNPLSFNDAYNATHGHVWATGALIRNVPGMNGSGVLATIIFKCIASGNSILSLTDSVLGDPDANPISHVVVGGYVETWPRNIAIKNVIPSTFEAYEGQIVNIDVVVKNEGNYTETFNVTAYYDDNIIETKTVTDLAPLAETTITFSWDTIGLAPDVNYTIKAEASVIPGETNITDNVLIDGTVRIKTVAVKTVELVACNQTGYPVSSFQVGSTASFKVTVNYTASGSEDVLMTINVYDADGATMGVSSFQGPIAQGTSVFILGLPIPTSAHVGNATVYASVFTDWPHLGGVPYCPERSATFEIAGP